MKLEEYGKENNSIIVMLPGANFVHCYGMMAYVEKHAYQKSDNEVKDKKIKVVICRRISSTQDRRLFQEPAD